MFQFLKKSRRKKDFPFKDDDFEITVAEEYCRGKESQVPCRSKLSKNLQDILQDKSCLSYFVQYLETRNVLPLIKFWLDVESFRIAAELCKNRDNILEEEKLSSTASSLVNDCESPQVEIKNNNLKNELTDICASDEDFSRLSNKKRLVSKSISTDCYDSLSCSNFEYTNSNGNSLRNDDDHDGDDNKSTTSSECVIGLSDTQSMCSGDDNNTQQNKSDTIKWRSLTDDEKSQIRRTEFQSSISTDAIRIYRKYLIGNTFDIPATILSDISLALCPSSTCDSNQINNTSPNCFDEAQNFVFNRLKSEYLDSFLESIFYLKFSVDILTSDDMTLNDIIYNENGLFYFREFLEQDNNRIYLDFWISAINFKKQLNENIKMYNHDQAQNDAMIIYSKYFSLQAENNLKMTDKVRYEIEEKICCETSEPILNCFDLAINITEYYLNRKYFNKFFNSTLFFKYLSELINKIKQQETTKFTKNSIKSKSSSSLTSRHRKSYSDCTSDITRDSDQLPSSTIPRYSITSQNTLLAMESNTIKRNKLPSSSSDMQIDSRQLQNPDLLWQRNTQTTTNGLSFGRINSLGRYERDFDSLEFSEYNNNNNKWNLLSSSNKLKRAVKKLVNLPEDKVQEELAWQVAEMIVKDVTNVTLCNSIENSKNLSDA